MFYSFHFFSFIFSLLRMKNRQSKRMIWTQIITHNCDQFDGDNKYYIWNRYFPLIRWMVLNEPEIAHKARGEWHPVAHSCSSKSICDNIQNFSHFPIKILLNKHSVLTISSQFTRLLFIVIILTKPFHPFQNVSASNIECNLSSRQFEGNNT